VRDASASNETSQRYSISGRGYLPRAKARLAEQTAEALFYAAFELRCGIEARMDQYLEARKDIARKKKHGYQIAKKAKALEHVFAAGEQIVSVAGQGDDGVEYFRLLFTPVTKELQKDAKRLGDLLLP
jgi:hypothetical protein